MAAEILITTAAGQIYRWDTDTDTVTFITNTALALTDIAVAPDGEIYVVTDDAFYRVDQNSGNAQFLFSLDPGLFPFFTPEIGGLTISSDGTGIVTFGDSNPIVEVNLVTGAQVQVGLGDNQFSPGIRDIDAFDFDGNTFFFAAQSNTFAFLNDSFQEITDRFYTPALAGIVAVPLDTPQFTAIGNFTSGSGFNAKLVGFAGTSAYDLGGFGAFKNFFFSSSITGAAIVPDGGSSSPPDDFAADATTTGVVIQGEAATGVLEQGADEDWFRMSLVEGVEYTVTLLASGADPIAGPLINILNDQSAFASGVSFNDMATSSSAVFTAGYTGTFFVSAASFDSSVTGTYSVTLEAEPGAIDTGGLALSLEEGDFVVTDVGGVPTASGSGTTLIGVTASPNLLRATGSQTQFTATSASIVADAFTPQIGGLASPLFAGQLDIDVASLSGTITSTGEPIFSLGSFGVEFTGVRLGNNALNFDAGLTLDNGQTGVAIQFDDALILDEGGFRFGVGGTLAIPDFALSLGSAKTFTVSGASLQYDGVEDEIRAQGAIATGIGGNTVVFDLTGDNFVAFGGTRPGGSPRPNGWDFVGEARFASEIPLSRRWGLEEATLGVNTETQELEVSATIKTPFGLTINPAEATISGALAYNPLELDAIRFEIDNLNKPLGNTALFLQGGFLELSGLVDNDNDAARATFGLDATLLPALPGVELTRFEGELSGSIEDRTLSGALMVTYLPVDISAFGFSLSGVFGTSSGSVEYNFADETLTLDGTHRFLGGLIQSDQEIVFDSNFNFSLTDRLAVTFPDDTLLLGGLTAAADIAVQFINDGDASNDTLSVWASARATETIGIGGFTTSFDVEFDLGLRFAFDGSVSLIGGDAITLGSSSQLGGGSIAGPDDSTPLNLVPEGSEYLLLAANWTNADTSAELIITLPDGTQLSEAEFAQNNITVIDDFSNEFGRVAFAFQPQAGLWSVDVTSPNPLGNVTSEILVSNARSDVIFNAVNWDQGARQLSIDYIATDGDSDAEVSFFISPNADGSEAILLGSGVETGEAQTFVWDATTTPSGEYTVFAVIDDAANAPRTVFANAGVDIVNVGAYDTLVSGTDGADFLVDEPGAQLFDGGSNVDIVRIAGNAADYTLTQTALGIFALEAPIDTDTLREIEFLEFDDGLVRLLPGTGVAVNFDSPDPSVYQDAMRAILDFDGNSLGGDGAWLRIGEADVNGDGDIDQILVNDAIARFATVGTAPDGLVYFNDNGWAGETRVAGIYIDPLVEAGIVDRFSPNDSQQRFQNDLAIENINRVLGADDYDGDGLQDVYFALTDGTAYLRAIMEADGNIRYANYQSQEQVIEFLNANGFFEETYGDWFPDPQAEMAGTVGLEAMLAMRIDGRAAFEPNPEFFG